MTSLWKNYDANSSYDEYLTPEKKLRREAKIISSILDKHGKKKLQEIDRNCMSTIDSRGINFLERVAGQRQDLDGNRR